MWYNKSVKVNSTVKTINNKYGGCSLELKLKFHGNREIYDFLHIVQECKGNVKASTESGDRKVDAKSTLGMFSLDLVNNAIIVYFENEEDKELIERWEITS